MKRNQIIVLLIVAAGVIGWAVFRPERRNWMGGFPSRAPLRQCQG